MITTAFPRSASLSLPQWWPAILAALAALGVAVWAATSNLDLAVFWAVGISLGFILQRSRFCFAGAFRDLFLSGDGRLMRALLAGLLIATPGFWMLMTRLVPDPSFGTIPNGAHVTPIGLHLVAGGLIFGIGMVVAGGCVSGTLFRIGEGYTASMVTLVGILAGLGFAAHTWNWWWTNHISQMPVVWLPGLLGHLPALALTMGLLGLAYLGVLYWEHRAGGPPPASGKKTALPLDFSERVRGWFTVVFRRGWPVLAGGIALAVLNVFSFTYEHPLGVTGVLSGFTESLTGLVGLSAGPLLGVDQFAGCNLAVGATTLITGSFMLTMGVIGGSFIGALASSEFKLRVPQRKSRYLQSVGGGALLGYGAGIAVGCTIGAFFSAIPSLSLSGWIFGLSLLGGAWLGTLIIRRLP